MVKAHNLKPQQLCCRILIGIIEIQVELLYEIQDILHIIRGEANKVYASVYANIPHEVSKHLDLLQFHRTNGDGV